MFRRALFDRTPRRDAEDDFRWRGEGVSRLENLSDIVFALAVSFLVATTGEPATFADLSVALTRFVAIAFCFAILLMVWSSHNTFFRRYALEDSRTVWLNAVLLFLILFYVYPLRFVAEFLTNVLMGHYASMREVSAVLSLDQMPALQLVYSGGYAAVFGVFALLYRHAARQADRLALTEIERVLTAERVAVSVVHVGAGLTAIALAFVLPVRLSPLSWAVYFLIGPLDYAVRRPYRRRYAALTESAA